MNEIERNLLSRRLAAPSAELDRRVARSFSTASAARRAKGPLLGWWWLATALTAGAAFTLLVMSRRSTSVAATEPLVYHIEAQGLLREMLLNSDPVSKGPAPFALRSPMP